MSKIPVNLCLHNIKDEGQQQAPSSASPVQVAVVSFPLSTESVPPPCLLRYQFGTNLPITVENYLQDTFMTNYHIPVAEWNHGIGTYYVAWAAQNEGETEPVYCPPLICRSDNQVIIIIDDELDVYEHLKNTQHSTQFFTNICPNEQGCVTLPIVLPQSENPYECTEFYALVYYYGKPDEISGQRKIIMQYFPIYDQNEILDLREVPNSEGGKQLRIGFKTYCETDSNNYIRETLAVVWVDFGIKPVINARN